MEDMRFRMREDATDDRHSAAAPWPSPNSDHTSTSCGSQLALLRRNGGAARIDLPSRHNLLEPALVIDSIEHRLRDNAVPFRNPFALAINAIAEPSGILGPRIACGRRRLPRQRYRRCSSCEGTLWPQLLTAITRTYASKPGPTFPLTPSTLPTFALKMFDAAGPEPACTM
jgi:hypothetical protein